MDASINSRSSSWTALLRAPAIALRGRVMLLAAAGVVAVATFDALVGSEVDPPPTIAAQLPALAQNSVQSLGQVWAALADPFTNLLAAEPILPNLLRCLWRLAVWGLVGGAIARVAALALTRGEAPAIGSALRFAWRRRSGFVGGPLLLLAGGVALALPLVLVRWALQVSWLASTAAVLWPVVIIAALLATLYAVAVTVGWPLAWAATAADGSDGFDSVSRMFAYVYQKPLRLAGYLLVVLCVSVLAAGAGQLLVDGVLATSNYAASQSASPWATSAIAWWHSAAQSLVVVYLTGLVWTSGVAVYLLRRQDVDGVHTDEVFIDADEYAGGLPTLSHDTTGVPVVDPGATDAEAA